MEPQCLVYGFLVSLAVSGLKKVPFVKAYPKTVAAILSAIIAIAEALITKSPPVEGTALSTGMAVGAVLAILSCVAAQFAASVATYETITKTAREASDGVIGDGRI